ncbi:TRAPP subunit [Acarospora aff. strigata]|nr:TRAPP subunit [Acarospora aff. strigata]
MSYYFCIIGTKDNPLFEHEFGTSKAGGDGIARFRPEARHMNQFVVHSSLDIVEEVQWLTGNMYLKIIDRFQSSHISCFLTGGNIKFLLLHLPTPPPSASGASSALNPSTSSLSSRVSSSSTSIAANPTSPATEEAIRQFMTEVYEVWVKNLMNPFYRVNMEVKSPVFRQRVAAAGRKYL